MQTSGRGITAVNVVFGLVVIIIIIIARIGRPENQWRLSRGPEYTIYMFTWYYTLVHGTAMMSHLAVNAYVYNFIIYIYMHRTLGMTGVSIRTSTAVDRDPKTVGRRADRSHSPNSRNRAVAVAAGKGRKQEGKWWIPGHVWIINHYSSALHFTGLCILYIRTVHCKISREKNNNLMNGD